MSGEVTTPARTKISLQILVNGKPEAVTPERLEALVEEAFARAAVPVQDSWVTYQKSRVTKKWTAFEEIVRSLL